MNLALLAILLELFLGVSLHFFKFFGVILHFKSFKSLESIKFLESLEFLDFLELDELERPSIFSKLLMYEMPDLTILFDIISLLCWVSVPEASFIF